MADASDIPRREIDELVARYRLEPTLRDLYVEGVRDQRIYERYFKDMGRRDVSVFQSGSIEVDRGTLAFHFLGEGNRNRVLALALELDRLFPTTLARVRCIVDSDFNFVLQCSITSNHLLQTDYTSVDLYACDRELFVQDQIWGLGLDEEDVEELFAWMVPILKEVFVIRACNQALAWGMAILVLTRCCSIVNSDVEFRRDDFVRRCLQRNGRTSEEDIFETTCAMLRSVHLGDDRQGIHSDDYLELLGWYLHHHHHWGGYRRGERSILDPLTSAMKPENLTKEPLFAQLNAIFN